MAETVSKRGAAAIMESSDFVERMRERMALGPDATPEQMSAAVGAAHALTTVRQRHWSKLIDDAEAQGKPLPYDQQTLLLKEAKETRDEGLVAMLDKSLSNGYKTSKGKWEKNEEMIRLRQAALTGGVRAIERVARMLGEGDRKKELALVQIGLWFIEGTSP
jgi:hypothetical protein